MRWPIEIAVICFAGACLAEEPTTVTTQASLEKINELRDSGKFLEAQKGYETACGPTKAAANKTVAVNCELNYAHLIEIWLDADSKGAAASGVSWKAAVEHYDAALTGGDITQKALAANNAAALELGQKEDNSAEATDYLTELSTLLGEYPEKPDDQLAQKAVYYGNLGDGWVRLAQWQAAFEAYRLGLLKKARPETVSDGVLEALKHLHSATDLSLIADLMISLNAGATATTLILKSLPYIESDFDWSFIYSPKRWFNHQKPWPSVMETLLESLDTTSVTPGDFEHEYWQMLADVRLGSGLGRAKLRASITALGEMYGVPDPERSRGFGPVTSIRKVDPNIRVISDAITASSILRKVAEYQDQSSTANSNGEALWRYAAAWMIYPNNVPAALDTAQIVKGATDKQSERLRTELWRTYVTLRRLEWRRYFLGVLRGDRPALDLSSSDRANLYTSIRGFGPFGAEEQLRAAVRRQVKRGSAAPEMYSLLGSLEPNADVIAAAEDYKQALQGYIDQNRDDKARETLNAIRLAEPDRIPEQMVPRKFRPEWIAMLLKAPVKAAPRGADVKLSPQDCAHVSSIKKLDATGLYRVEFAEPLEKCTLIELAGDFHGTSLQVEEDRSEIDRLHDRDTVISGKAVTSTNVIDLTIKFNDFEPREHIIAPLDPFTGEFRVRLRKALVAGQSVSLRALDGDKANELRNATVKPLRLDSGRLRIYAKVGTSVGFSGITDVSNLLVGFGYDYNFHTWHQDNFLVRERGSAKSAAAVLLNAYFEGNVSPLLVSAYCIQPSCRTKLVQPPQSATFEFGMYAPIIPMWKKLATRSIRGVSNGYFIAPLVKGGVQNISPAPVNAAPLLETGPNQPFWSAGLRLGHLRFVSSDKGVSPSLLSYFDVTWGRWDRFAIPMEQTGIRVPTRFETTGLVKLPRTPLSVGFLTNIRRGLNEYRLFAVLRIDVFNELARLRKEISHNSAGK